MSVLEFIKNFKESDRSHVLEKTFLQGYCYYFAVILEERFPGGMILYDKEAAHFVYFYEGKLYDITGNVTGQYHQLNTKWNSTITKECILKENGG